jgi:hypothetical protein
MNAVLTVLGMAMLILASAAALLAIVLLVLYEALWVIRLGGKLYRSARIADRPSHHSHTKYDRIGGD